MASFLRQAASLWKASFHLVVVSAPLYLVQSCLLSLAPRTLPARTPTLDAEAEKAKDRWIDFATRLPNNAATLFCGPIAKELAAVYRADAESKRDAACWASEMAKWESAAEDPQFEQHRGTHKEAQELLDGVLSRILFCEQQGILADAATFWNSVASKRFEDATKFSSEAMVEADAAAKQALTENANGAEDEGMKAKTRAKEAQQEAQAKAKDKAVTFTILWCVIGLIFGFVLGLPSRRRIKLLRLCGLLSEQEAEFAMIVENTSMEPAVLTNFRGCCKTTVCTKYHQHQIFIGRRCVYITDSGEKKHPMADRLFEVWEPDVRREVVVLALCATTLLWGLVLRRLPVSISAAVAIGFFTPRFVKRRVAIFDDVTSKHMYGSAAGGKPKFAQYTNIPVVVKAAYHGSTYGGRDWIHVVVNSNEGIRLLQRDSKYDYRPFPVSSAEELRGAIQYAIGRSGRKGDKRDFPPPTVDEIERAVKRYGEWWGRSFRFWVLPFSDSDVHFYNRMRCGELTANDIGRLATDLDLSCNSGPAPLIGSPPIDVSKFNEAFAAIGGKGLLEDAVRGLYRNKRRAVDVHRFPRRLLHSVMWSLVATEPLPNLREKVELKLAEIKERAVPLTPSGWEESAVLLAPLGQNFRSKNWMGYFAERN